MTTVEETTLSILSSVTRIPLEKLKPEARLVHDLGIDSITTLDLLLELEDSFDIEIPETEAAQMQTVAQVLDYMQKNASIE